MYNNFFTHISYILHFFNHSLKNIFNGNFIVQEHNNSSGLFYSMANCNCLTKYVGHKQIWPNPLMRRKRDWIFHHVLWKKIPHESRETCHIQQMGNFTNPFFSLVTDWHSYIASEIFAYFEFFKRGELAISIHHTWGIFPL